MSVLRKKYLEVVVFVVIVVLIAIPGCGDSSDTDVESNARDAEAADAGAAPTDADIVSSDSGQHADASTSVDASPEQDGDSDAEFDADCEPRTACEAAECGLIDDGCGGKLDCGDPRTTCMPGECGMVDDGCGGVLDCGEPRTVCRPDECGFVDDGCGGVLECDGQARSCGLNECGLVNVGCGGVIDCGECNCINGISQGNDCGTCGLGHYVCAPGETGFGECVSPELPGFGDVWTYAECDARIRYVDPASPFGGNGTPGQPYQYLYRALDDATPGTILLLARSVDHIGPFQVVDGVSMIGGFAPSSWEFDPERPSVVRNVGGGGFRATRYGLEARDVHSPTLLANLHVIIERVGPSSNNIGMRLVDSTGITLRQMVIEGGDSPDLPGGSQRNAGDDGPDGFNGFGARGGGQERENSACPAANGGAAGSGAFLPDYTTGLPLPGGDSPGGAAGGAAATMSNKSGSDGSDGADGLPGANGTNGVFGGSVLIDDWVSTGDGTAASAGTPGQGGGGGGGSWHGGQYCSMTDGTPLYWSGSTGATGGAGGCGGPGGRVGYSGGAAIGMLLVRSLVIVQDSTIIAGDGGNGSGGENGGPGGAGGTGGNGVSIGTGSGYLCDPVDTSISSVSHPWSSGNGGDGGDGGEGGDGGAGAGGPSWGILCDGLSNPVIDSSSTIVFGTPGVGGVSSFGVADSGVAAERHNCP